MKTWILLAVAAMGTRALVQAQTPQNDGDRWMAGADIAPPFAAPATKAAWETERLNIRAELWTMLGKLPPRPPVSSVETL
jgi:hypothetical protein